MLITACDLANVVRLSSHCSDDAHTWITRRTQGQVYCSARGFSLSHHMGSSKGHTRALRVSGSPATDNTRRLYNNWGMRMIASEEIPFQECVFGVEGNVVCLPVELEQFVDS